MVTVKNGDITCLAGTLLSDQNQVQVLKTNS